MRSGNRRGNFILICNSGKSADFPELPLHGRGRYGQWHFRSKRLFTGGVVTGSGIGCCWPAAKTQREQVLLREAGSPSQALTHQPLPLLASPSSPGRGKSFPKGRASGVTRKSTALPRTLPLGEVDANNVSGRRGRGRRPKKTNLEGFLPRKTRVHPVARQPQAGSSKCNQPERPFL